MKAEIISGSAFDEDGQAHNTYGFKIGGRSFDDVSLNKSFVARLVHFLNDDPAPLECIETVLEDYMSGEGEFK